MKWLRRWWPLLALVGVLGTFVGGMLLSLDEPQPNIDHPLYFVYPTNMTDDVRNH